MNRPGTYIGRRRWMGGLALLGGSALWPQRAGAHPYHVSLTEAHHKPSSRTLELSVRVRPEDMQAALRNAGHAKLQIDGVESAALERMCTAYLRKRFIFCDRQPARLPLAYVGHELDERWMWMHFAFPVGEVADLRGFHLDNRIFYEIAPSQANTVNLHHAGTQQTLIFRASVPVDVIAAPA